MANETLEARVASLERRNAELCELLAEIMERKSRHLADASGPFARYDSEQWRIYSERVAALGGSHGR